MVACSDGDSGQGPLPDFIDPIWIVCEGNFGARNSSLSVLDTTVSDTTFLDVFRRVNGARLGDFAHAMAVADTIAWVCVTNSDRVEIMDVRTGERLGQIHVAGPRNALMENDALYVASHDDSAVFVFARPYWLAVDTIRLRHRPDEMAVAGGRLFISNSPSSTDSILSVFDMLSGDLDTMTIGLNPISVAASSHDGLVYVACAGSAGVAGFVAVVDPTPSVVVARIGEYANIHPVKCIVDEAWLASIRYSNGPVDIYSTDTRTLLHTVSGNFSGIGMRHGQLFTLDANDYVSSGTLRRYHPDFSFQKAYPVGIAPSAIVFKN